jgi:hypothetical protein
MSTEEVRYRVAAAKTGVGLWHLKIKLLLEEE